MTLFSVFLIAVLSRPRVTTTAIVITPRTTAYSAMVWPASSRTSADSVVKNSLMGLTSPGGIDGIPVVPIRSVVSAQAGIALFSEFSFLGARRSRARIGPVQQPQRRLDRPDGALRDRVEHEDRLVGAGFGQAVQ